MDGIGMTRWPSASPNWPMVERASPPVRLSSPRSRGASERHQTMPPKVSVLAPGSASPPATSVRRSVPEASSVSRPSLALTEMAGC